MLDLAGALLGRLHLWIGLMILLYLGSGITIVRADEAALVLRFGRLVGEGTAAAVHPPGLLFALPRPFDEVVRVSVRKVYQVDVTTLSDAGAETRFPRTTLDPILVGYALTGDHNIVHAHFTAKYQVGDPVQWALFASQPERTLVDVLTGEAARTIGETSVDSVLSEGRADLVQKIRDRVQARLDEAGLGVQLVSLEVVALAPPSAVESDFTAVQSAHIQARTKQEDAEAEQASAIPAAQAAAAQKVSDAKSYAVTTKALAESTSTAFRALVAEYRANPGVVRDRLYHDGVTQVMAAAGKRVLVPPPLNGKYPDLRLTVSSGKSP
jgi:membrane protease subunit HflK